jgi:hypothetical protein
MCVVPRADLTSPGCAPSVDAAEAGGSSCNNSMFNSFAPAENLLCLSASSRRPPALEAKVPRMTLLPSANVYAVFSIGAKDDVELNALRIVVAEPLRVTASPQACRRLAGVDHVRPLTSSPPVSGALCQTVNATSTVVVLERTCMPAVRSSTVFGSSFESSRASVVR